MKIIFLNTLLFGLITALAAGCAASSRKSGYMSQKRKSDLAAKQFAEESISDGKYTNQSIASNMSKKTAAATVSYRNDKSSNGATCSSPNHKH